MNDEGTLKEFAGCVVLMVSSTLRNLDNSEMTYKRLPPAHISSSPNAASLSQCLMANTEVVISAFPATTPSARHRKQQRQLLQGSKGEAYFSLKYHFLRKSSLVFPLQCFGVVYCLSSSINSKAFVGFISPVLKMAPQELT